MTMSEQDTTESYVHDSTKDFKGRTPLRASTGAWKAALHVIALEMSEKIITFGIGSNIISYFTTIMGQDLKTAINNVNIWSGINTVTPIIGGYIADAYTGRYSMIIFASIFYLMGLFLFTMAQYIPSLKPCITSSHSSTGCHQVTDVHKGVFFLAMYILSIAMGGFRPCLQAFGADQFDSNHAKERKQKMSFFNWWNACVCVGLFLGVTLIAYIEDNIGWGVAFLTLGLIMLSMFVVFVIGTPYYRHMIAKGGSPLSPVWNVIAAAFAKRNLPHPSDPSLLYEVPKAEKSLVHTDMLRFLDKAAIIEEHEREGQKPRKIATVTQVEELKLLINMVPIWFTSLVFGVGNAQGPTFFTKQGSEMDRRVYKHFEIPSASLGTVAAISLFIATALYDKVLIPYLRRVRRNERGISILTRISIGMVLLMLAYFVAAVVENRRLAALQEGRMISVLWLAPQSMLIGIGDAFSVVGMQEYFYEQVPDSMRSLGMAFFLCVQGLGGVITSFIIFVVNSIAAANGRKIWIGNDVNSSRIDYFFALLTVIFAVNTSVFMCLARSKRYRNSKRCVELVDSDENDGDKVVEMSRV